jgi:lipoprotein-anchoring transpeptidase ErfK/SrfK
MRKATRRESSAGQKHAAPGAWKRWNNVRETPRNSSMKILLFTALTALCFLVSARAEIRVVVSIRNQTAWLVNGNRILMTSAVSTAKRGMHTPTGHFEVSEKDASHISTIYHVAMPFYMRLSGKPFGMHAGYMPGYPASHGCIRMPREKAAWFFKNVIVGTSVRILPN